MSEIAFGQLMWALFGMIAGSLATTSCLLHRLRPVNVDVKIDWDTIGPGVGGALNEAAKNIAVNRANITVDWSLIHDAIEGGGYTLVKKPEGDYTAHKH